MLTYGDAPPAPAPELPGEVASGGSCLPDGLEALPAVDVAPGIAILCGSAEQCPCGWRCCQQCSEGEGGMEVCSGYAICRKPKEELEELEEEKKDYGESMELEIEPR